MPPTVGGGPWTLDAAAWYVWNIGIGSGADALEIDAFSITDNDFIPDYSVDGFPDAPTPDHPDSGSLTDRANDDGFINTDTLTHTEVVTAREIIGDRIQRHRFSHWLGVDSLTQGGPTAHDSRLCVHPGDTIVAYAMDERIQPALPRVDVWDYPNVTLLPSDAGLVWIVWPHPWPLGPPKPMGQLFGAARLVDAARFVRGQTRAELLHGAERLTQAALDRIRTQVPEPK